MEFENLISAGIWTQRKGAPKEKVQLPADCLWTVRWPLSFEQRAQAGDYRQGLLTTAEEGDSDLYVKRGTLGFGQISSCCIVYKLVETLHAQLWRAGE